MSKVIRAKAKSRAGGNKSQFGQLRPRPAAKAEEEARPKVKPKKPRSKKVATAKPKKPKRVFDAMLHAFALDCECRGVSAFESKLLRTVILEEMQRLNMVGRWMLAPAPASPAFDVVVCAGEEKGIEIAVQCTDSQANRIVADFNSIMEEGGATARVEAQRVPTREYFQDYTMDWWQNMHQWVVIEPREPMPGFTREEVFVVEVNHASGRGDLVEVLWRCDGQRDYLRPATFRIVDVAPSSSVPPKLAYDDAARKVFAKNQEAARKLAEYKEAE